MFSQSSLQAGIEYCFQIIFMWPGTLYTKVCKPHVCWDWDQQFVLGLKLQFFQLLLSLLCIWHLMIFVLSEENYVLCASEIIEIKANFLWSFNSFYAQLDCLWMYHEGTFCILLHIGLQLLEIKESFHLVHFYKAIYFFVQKEDILFCEQNIITPEL